MGGGGVDEMVGSRWGGVYGGGGVQCTWHGEFYQLIESTLCMSTHGSVQCTTVVFLIVHGGHRDVYKCV